MIRSFHLLFVLCMATLFAQAQAASQAPVVLGSDAGERLPNKTDISANFTSILCPTRAAALTMLQDYLLPGDVDYQKPVVMDLPIPGGIVFDLASFQRGLKQTSCRLAQEPIHIQWTLARKTLVTADASKVGYLVFSGNSKLAHQWGDQRFGIVHEALNNSAPRSLFERWQLFNAPLGTFQRNANSVKDAWVCQRSNSAVKLIALRKAIDQEPNDAQLKQQADALSKQCKPAVGQFVPIKVLAHLAIDSTATMMAILAEDQHGKRIGLLHMAHAIAVEIE